MSRASKRFLTSLPPHRWRIKPNLHGVCAAHLFDRFLSKPFRHLLETSFGEQPVHARHGGRKVWAPEGISALRADGSEFPVELTISETDAEQESLFTLILRDVNERKRAERKLKQLMLETEYLKEEIRQHVGSTEIVSVSAAMQELLAQVERVAVTDATVLLSRETGVGKELIARALHNRSERNNRALVKLNCAALPSDRTTLLSWPVRS